MNEDSMPLSMMIVTLSLSQCGESLCMMSLSLYLSMKIIVRVSLFLPVSLNQQGFHLDEGACLSFPLSPLSLNGHSLSLFLSLSQWGEWGETLSLYMNEDGMPLSMMIVTLSLSLCGESLSMMSLSLYQ